MEVSIQMMDAAEEKKRVQLKAKYITQIRGGLPPRKGAYGSDWFIISKNTDEKEKKTP